MGIFQTTVLASGSKGNAILVKTDSTKILIDVGLSGRKLSKQLRKLALNENKIKAVVVSHEHSDHVKGVGVICRKFKIPLYINENTYYSCSRLLGKLPRGKNFFQNGDEFTIDDLVINAFAASHDVVDGSNFIVKNKNLQDRKLAILTDLGFSGRLTINKIKKSTTVIIESNHDLDMLMNGPYPWHLKQRVKSREGHLSNEQAVAVISQVIHPGLKNIVLAHLSEKNNTPGKAKNLMESYLKEIKFKLNLLVANQYEPTEIIDV